MICQNSIRKEASLSEKILVIKEVEEAAILINQKRVSLIDQEKLLERRKDLQIKVLIKL